MKKIALLGFGKMGKSIASLAETADAEIVAQFSRRAPATPEALKEASVCIDFSHPDAVLNHVKVAAVAKKPIVIGTTGWLEEMEMVKKIVKEANIGCLFSPNFSIGIALFRAIVEEATKRIQHFPEYDTGMIEMHHAAKADAPSGTANMLASVAGNPPIASLRCGSIPGTHQILFDSPIDTITLTHTARSRDGFALGALKAAHWIDGKTGFFTMEDLFR